MISSISPVLLLSVVLFDSAVIVCRGNFGQGRRMKKNIQLMEIFAMYVS